MTLGTSSTPTFTIAIPTYNRVETVTRRVQEFVALGAQGNLELLVIDNASTDGTYAQLAEFVQSGVRVLQNTSNIGYVGNFFRLIEEARSDYVIFMSDEDQLEVDGLEELIRFCTESRPQVVSPRAQVRGNSAYRGRRKTGEIPATAFESASFYVSGLTLETERARDGVPVVRRLVPENSAANIYPQVLLTALLIAGGRAYFLDALVSTQVEELETHIAEHSGDDYFTVSSRWQQFMGFEAFFDLDHSSLLGAEGMKALAAMRDHKRAELLKVLHRTAVAQVPELKPYFMKTHWSFGLQYLKSRVLKR